MDSEQSAAISAAQRHHKYMNFGKKQRYIEVFQCSIDDMNLVLTGGMPLQRHIQASGKFRTVKSLLSIMAPARSLQMLGTLITQLNNHCKCTTSIVYPVKKRNIKW